MSKEGKKEKFSSHMDAGVLKELRDYSRDSRRNISDILSEAVANYLGRVQVRSVFRDPVSEVFEEHNELLEKLTK